MVDGQIGWPGLPVQLLVGQECKHALACAATLFLATAEVTVLGTCTRHRRVPQQLVEVEFLFHMCHFEFLVMEETPKI